MSITQKTALFILFFGLQTHHCVAIVESVEPEVKKIAQKAASLKIKARTAFHSTAKELKEFSEGIKDIFHTLQTKYAHEINQLKQLKKQTSSILFGDYSPVTAFIHENDHNDAYLIEITGITNQENETFNAVLGYDKNDLPISAKISTAMQTITVRYSIEQSYIQIMVITQTEEHIQEEKNTTNMPKNQPIVTTRKIFGKSIKKPLNLDLLAVKYSVSDQKITITIPIVMQEVKTKSIEISVT